MSKNESRISALMGTWTAQVEMKAVVGNYKLVAYFVVHMMPDPMRGYGCELSECTELENHVCKRVSNVETCVDLKDEALDWSDVSVFLYFGARVDAGIPFNVHVERNTGGWVGPYSILMAKNATSLDETTMDRYVARYVESPSTPYLQFNPKCTLFVPDDFEKYMGKTAVKATVKAQADLVPGADPYAPYLKTCDNGDVKPILPLFDFTFLRGDGGKERIDVKLNHKILTFPHKTDIMYKVFPILQKSMNSRNGDFHISGPYCYGDDPKRGYSFDFQYDSRHEKSIKVIHGCLEGLPCLPEAGQIAATAGNSSATIVHNRTEIGDDSLVLGGPILFLLLSNLFFIVAFLVALVWGCRASCARRRNEDLGGDLLQPLLDREEEGNDDDDDAQQHEEERSGNDNDTNDRGPV